MLRVYRRHDDRLLPTDLEVTAQSRPAEAAGASFTDTAAWLGLIRKAMLQALRQEACARPILSWPPSPLQRWSTAQNRSRGITSRHLRRRIIY